MQSKFWVTAILILGALAFLMYNGINDSMFRYVEVSELLANESRFLDSGIRLTGHVQEGSIERPGQGYRITFHILDRDSGKSLPVSYQGDIPDTFQDGAEVVVDGRFNPTPGVFEATMLLAKCPSKYEKETSQASAG